LRSVRFRRQTAILQTVLNRTTLRIPPAMAHFLDSFAAFTRLLGFNRQRKFALTKLRKFALTKLRAIQTVWHDALQNPAVSVLTTLLVRATITRSTIVQSFAPEAATHRLQAALRRQMTWRMQSIHLRKMPRTQLPWHAQPSALMPSSHASRQAVSFGQQ
jgi:hypothetical protein